MNRNSYKKTGIFILGILISVNAFCQNDTLWYKDWFARIAPLKATDGKILNLINENKNTTNSGLGYPLSFIGFQGQSDVLNYNPENNDANIPKAIEDCSYQKYEQINFRGIDSLIHLISYDYEIVMINEAHTKLQHRAFVKLLLKQFYDAGFRYLAVEALGYFKTCCTGGKEWVDSLDYQLVTKPKNYNGYYTYDSQMYNMLKEAENLGFTLVGYDYAHNEKRDSLGAINLLSQVNFSKGKLLSYSGYGHFENTSGRLGYYLEKMTQKKIFRIDQTMVIEDFQKTIFTSIYKCISRRANLPSKPYILYENQVPFKTKPNTYADLHIYWPPVIYENYRPTWLKSMPNVIKHSVKVNKNKNIVLVQAFRAKHPDETAFDQTFCLKNQTKVDLYLEKGDYLITMTDNKGNSTSQKIKIK